MRAADALAAICGARDNSESGRASVVIHAGVDDLADEAVRRMACDGSVRLVEHGPDGAVVGVHRATRVPPPWLVQLVRRRDKGCRFPACGRTRWTHCHHLVFWSKGGATNLDNLALLCSYHHKTVHEGGWRVEGEPNGELRFIRPNGALLKTGPPPLDPRVRKRTLGDPEAA